MQRRNPGKHRIKYHHMKISDLVDKINKKNRYIIPLTQGLLTIALVIAVSVISIHLLMGNTLSDYAEANPEKAYGVAKEPIEESDPKLNETSASTSSDQSIADSSGSVSDTEKENEKDSVSEQESTDENSGNAEQDSTGTSNDNSENSDEANNKLEQSYGVDNDLPDYNRSVKIHFYNPEITSSESSDVSSARTTYSPGFYYEPLSADIKEYITGVSYPIEGNPAVSYDELRYVGILFYDFNGLIQAGELICNEYIADDLVEIFDELYKAEYRLESVVLIDNFGGDDTASMCADNTSCFNYRVVEGSTSLSKHARGLAIDVNPFYNPYIVFGKGEGGSDYISPPGSEIYADRLAFFAYKIDENDLCYRLFKAHGFVWGGDWNSCKDYQHFQKVPN